MLTTRAAGALFVVVLTGALLAAQELPPAPPAGQTRPASGLSWLNEDQIAERGARLARRDNREYREYLRAEQRCQPGCPAREVVLDQRGQATSQGRGGRGGGEATREFLGLGRQPDPAKAARGEKLYAASCAFCHGADARGAEAPSLLRSEIVLHDDKGELIGPVVQHGRPEKGMPPMPATTPEQISEIAEYLHLLVERAANRGLFGSIYSADIRGDEKAGEAFFNGAGRCSTCHSPTGDLAHVGSKYRGPALQNRWLWPSGGRGNARALQATVTLPSGERVTGLMKRLDDFDVSIVDATGTYRSWPRDAVSVQIPDPLDAHRARLATYSDSQIHDVTAFLATLK